ncbi:BON domain-containing protein [Plastorhodobacter daqingensis]|uniref:BON domain-containing protein n=1 Tax=Plastorhodobacter daqingensis TaxID=1387281 RepID=A0ABW2UIE5_9RHOB
MSDADRPGTSGAKRDSDGRTAGSVAPETGTHDRDERQDKAGFDTSPPPTDPGQSHRNPGLHDGPPPEQEGWREFDVDSPSGTWVGDAPYPGPPPTTDEEAAIPEDDVPQRDAGADILLTLTAVLEEDVTLEIDDLSVEVRGTTVILRGSAARPEDRERAADLAGNIGAVERVENLIAVNN